jgi:hypothetical protein
VHREFVMALFTVLLILLAALVLYGALRLYREFTRPWHPGRHLYDRNDPDARSSVPPEQNVPEQRSPPRRRRPF